MPVLTIALNVFKVSFYIYTGSTVPKRYFQKMMIMRRTKGWSCSHCEIKVNELEFACDIVNRNAPISEFITA